MLFRSSGEDSGGQGKAEWKAKEIVSCSLEMETKIFLGLRVYLDCIVGVLEVEFHPLEIRD